MKFALSIPNFGQYGDARILGALAQEAEQSGWDGLFIWDHINQESAVPMVDPWVALGAMAISTTRIRIGPMVTPVARRRPWKLAREALTVDHLSGGRLILGVGLGWAGHEDFEPFGEDAEAHVRAQKLDEGLAILDGLWTTRPFSYEGQHFRIKNVTMLPPPLQQPRIPIWVAGIWPNKAPMRRAARWDGAFPGSFTPFTPDDIRAIAAYIRAHRTTDDPFDIVHGAPTTGVDPQGDAAMIASFGEAGVTWWIDGTAEGTLAATRARIHRGPPR